LDDQQIQEEWEAALEDAGLASEGCVLFLSDSTPLDEGRGAQWWEPGMTIEPDDQLVTENLAAEANSPENRDRHRIVVRRPFTSDPASVARFSGKLRHELEHARQWDACGLPVFALNNVADGVLQLKVVGLPGGRVFTNLKPVEQDANAASAMFLRARWPDTIRFLLDDPEHAPLVRSLTPPGRPETLLTRMVAFLYLYEDLCARLEETWAGAISFAEYLDQIAPGAGELWRTLRTTAEKFKPPTRTPEPPGHTDWG
jgi:hypothetical protein